MKKKRLSLLITILMLLLTLAISACGTPPPTIDYSKYNYYGDYTLTYPNSAGGTSYVTLQLGTNGQYEMSLDAYDMNHLHINDIVEKGSYTMDTLQEPVYDDTFKAIYILRFSPYITTGFVGTEYVYVYSGYITSVTFKDWWWFYIDHYQSGVSIYLGDDDNSLKMKHNSSSQGGNGDSSQKGGNGDSSSQTPSYTLNYSVNNTDYGYITGNTTQTVDENGNGTSVTAVANDGYKFTGWSDGVSTATRQDMNVVVNVNVTANFIPVYALNYSVNNTEYGYITGNTTQAVDENGNGTSVTAVANDGYKFTGWSDGVSTATRQDRNVFSSVNVTANFEQKKLYKFTLYDGGVISSIDIQEDSIIKLDNLTKQGYTFDGWSINGQLKQAGEAITIMGNTTAYAEWTIDTYNITYHLGDGALENKKTSFTIHDLTYELPMPIPQGEWSFVKWTTDEAGENEIKTITELGDYTLYAHYEDSAKFLTYKYSEELQGYEVSDYTGNAKEVKIPSTYKGVAVKGIGDSAFRDCRSLTSISIPDSVTSIGDSAFLYCSSLTSITLPDGVTYIGDSAFGHCSSLTSIEIPNGVTSIAHWMFFGCSSLTSIIIPDGVRWINGAFDNCTSLTSVTIGNSVEGISARAFENCSSLTEIIIPASITDLNSSAFYNCINLKTWFIHSSAVANSNGLGELLQYATDVYIRADITVTLSIYNVIFNNLGKEMIDGVEYYHYQIKGE